ncbi:MAG: hypothetical protein HRU17_08010 [Polyangiaceae bacterium]|nr:hypothetical protein [Polyangiaceae bacterium]
MFTDGVSSRDHTTNTSGRGVGMSAIKAACHDIGGEVEVRSVPGAGTVVRFIVQWPPRTPPPKAEQPAA